jgi:cell division septation protein DedD
VAGSEVGEKPRVAAHGVGVEVGQRRRQKRWSAASGGSSTAAVNDTIVAAAISRSPGREGFPPLRRSSQSETPAPSTVQKQSAAGCVFTPAMKVRPLAA